MATDLVDTVEMYLRTVLDLEEEGIPALRARLSERLGHAGATVSQTVARMQRRGLIAVASDRVLELTADGRALAVSVLRKHRIAERFLTDVVGLEWAYAHQEACKWEHVMSDRVAEHLFALLDGPRCSPYGNPIPPRPARCQMRAPDAVPRRRAYALAQLIRDDALPQRVTLVWVSEGLQATAGALAELHAQGVTPGCGMMIRRRPGGAIRVRTDHETPTTIRTDLWPHLFVQEALA
ncbi:metal-dependent transcriptional regulator [Leucobacter chromiireducens]|nr:metal-dependent transcriptional regulator [Leucobacter chromiireducens]